MKLSFRRDKFRKKEKFTFLKNQKKNLSELGKLIFL